jgi:hypothetical protein
MTAIGQKGRPRIMEPTVRSVRSIHRAGCTHEARRHLGAAEGLQVGQAQYRQLASGVGTVAVFVEGEGEVFPIRRNDGIGQRLMFDEVRNRQFCRAGRGAKRHPGVCKPRRKSASAMRPC